MNLPQILEYLDRDPGFKRNVSAWRIIPSRPAKTAPIPPEVPRRLTEALRRMGIDRLYTHQAEAVSASLAGENVTVVTPTASGKTLCYNLPVLTAILDDPEARALYLFPTKALARDQLVSLHELVRLLEAPLKIYTFDGDTPGNIRRTIRSSGHVVVSNPDMLHAGILPHHTHWIKLFENLKYVVVDEMHHYRGVFGSHMANVIRRLKRICDFYGSSPRFFFSSATIANPEEVASILLEEDTVLINESGAPSGERHFIVYNPPVVNAELGLRKSVVKESAAVAARFVANGVQTIVFARSRLNTEVIVRYLKDTLKRSNKPSAWVRGYRGGYLPRERQAIERGLREGSVRGVVSTNALELGIDIGRLDVSVLAGYPGTVSSMWQQAGRAGRRQSVSASIMVASSSPLDQYLAAHPDYLFGLPPELSALDPDNLVILMSHIKCGAFEIPFGDGESRFPDGVGDCLGYLEDHEVLHRAGGRWFWSAESYPAGDISLRTASPENFVIINRDADDAVIGEVDFPSAPLLLHEDAVYMHEGRTFQVERLDWEGQVAYVREVSVNYYTDANVKTDIRIIDEFRTEPAGRGWRSEGEVSVTLIVPMYKKIKFDTRENLGTGRITLPPQEMHTTSFWYSLDPPEGADFLPDIGGGLRGVAELFQNLAPLLVMCDPRDIRAVSMVRSPFNGLPVVHIYDNHPGGVGFTARLYRQFPSLVERALERVSECGCPSGCPSCVGPELVVGKAGKRTARDLLGFITGDRDG